MYLPTYMFEWQLQPKDPAYLKITQTINQAMRSGDQSTLVKSPVLQFTLCCNTYTSLMIDTDINYGHRTAYPESVTGAPSDDSLSIFHYLSDTDSVDAVVVP